MKTRLAIILLVIFTIDICGYYIVFSVRQIIIKEKIKNSIRQNLPDEKLTLVISNPSTKKEIYWKEKLEFRYRKNMYDIVRIVVKSSDTIFYYCINDKAETKLFSNLEEFVKKTKQTQKEDSSRLQTYQTFHSTLFFKQTKDNFYNFNPEVYLFTYIGAVYECRFPDILNPPPETANCNS